MFKRFNDYNYTATVCLSVFVLLCASVAAVKSLVVNMINGTNYSQCMNV